MEYIGMLPQNFICVKPISSPYAVHRKKETS